MISPPRPTAMPFCASKKWMARMLALMGAGTGVHVVPPSAVRRSREPVAAAKPSWSLAKCRATKALVVPLV
jgi:hypothetical protein